MAEIEAIVSETKTLIKRLDIVVDKEIWLERSPLNMIRLNIELCLLSKQRALMIQCLLNLTNRLAKVGDCTSYAPIHYSTLVYSTTLNLTGLMTRKLCQNVTPQRSTQDVSE